MKLRTPSILACVLLVRALVFAQSSPAADPVSGNWGMDGATFLELKFDGTRTVTGTAIWRGGGQSMRTPIKNGTFDPKTRALRLEGEGKRPDGVGGVYVIQGTVDGDTVSGTYKFADDTGQFRFTRQAPESPGKRTPEQIEASYQAHKGDFDYLLGDWEYSATSKEHGKFRGYWSAVRLAEGQILDEYRIVGDKGETYYVTTTLRNYNKVLDRWELIGADAGTGLQDFGTGRRVGPEVHIEQKFGVMSDQPSTWRIRYYNLRPDSFSWTADRSLDDGKTWEKNHQQIEARRIGPARSLGPLAPARNKTEAVAGPSGERAAPVGGAGADPISGTWTGYMGRTDTERQPIIRTLRSAGKDISGTITGPPSPGEIRTGTFDRTKGTLRLEIVVQDDAKTIAIFEGTLVGDAITGRVSLNSQTGVFSIKRNTGGSQ